MNSIGIVDFLPELLIIILEKLDIKRSLFNVMLTCKRFGGFIKLIIKTIDIICYPKN